MMVPHDIHSVGNVMFRIFKTTHSLEKHMFISLSSLSCSHTGNGFTMCYY